MTRGRELSPAVEGPRLALISPRSLVEMEIKTGEIAKSVRASVDAANVIIKPFGDEAIMPEIDLRSLADFGHFLNRNGQVASWISGFTLHLGRAKKPEERGNIRNQFLDVVHGNPPTSLKSRISWFPEYELFRMAFLKEDPHLRKHYQPTLAKLHALGLLFEVQLSQAGETIDKAISNQDKTTTTYIRRAGSFRRELSLAQQYGKTVDSLVHELRQGTLGYVDIGRSTHLDALIERANRESKTEFNAWKIAAELRTQAGISFGAFFPALGSSEAAIISWDGLQLGDEMANLTFLYVLNRYLFDIINAMQKANHQVLDIFRTFREGVEVGGQQLLARILEIRDTLKLIPAGTGTNK